MSGTNLATIREPKIRAKYGQAESFHVSTDVTDTPACTSIYANTQLQSAYSIHYSDIHLDTYINWQILWNRPLCVQQHISKKLLLCAAEGGRQFVSECCSRLLVRQLRLQTSNTTPGHKAFQMSLHCAEFYRKKTDSIRGYACFSEARARKSTQNLTSCLQSWGISSLLLTVFAKDFGDCQYELNLCSCQG